MANGNRMGLSLTSVGSREVCVEERALSSRAREPKTLGLVDSRVKAGQAECGTGEKPLQREGHG